MKNNSSRRSFIGKAAAAGSAAVAGSHIAQAQPQPESPSADLLRVGVIALGDNSHMNYSIWAPMINPTEPDVWPAGRTTGMKITAKSRRNWVNGSRNLFSAPLKYQLPIGL